MIMIELSDDAEKPKEKRRYAMQAILSINRTIEELISSIEASSTIAHTRLDNFVQAYTTEFPLEPLLEDRGRADALTWALMDGPLVLYAIGMNGSAIIELHGILERFVLRETVNHLADPSKRSPTYRVLKRRTLSDLASMLCDLEVFDREDVKFAEKLNALRNGLAHKNPEVISKLLFSGKEISFLDIDSAIGKFDCVPLIVGTIRLLVRMSKTSNVVNQ